MAASSSGLKTDVAGSAPAALMSSNTEASQEKVSRADGTCTQAKCHPGYDHPSPYHFLHRIPAVRSLEVPSPALRGPGSRKVIQNAKTCEVHPSSPAHIHSGPGLGLPPASALLRPAAQKATSRSAMPRARTGRAQAAAPWHRRSLWGTEHELNSTANMPPAPSQPQATHPAAGSRLAGAHAVEHKCICAAPAAPPFPAWPWSSASSAAPRPRFYVESSMVRLPPRELHPFFPS